MGLLPSTLSHRQQLTRVGNWLTLTVMDARIVGSDGRLQLAGFLAVPCDRQQIAV
jgi:hypothetical protein